MAKRDLRIAVLGGVVARAGRDALRAVLPALRERERLDCVIVNGENAAGGMGVDAATATEIRKAGADIVTLGDHAFHRKGSREFLESAFSWCIRPANFPPGTSGSGTASWAIPDTEHEVGICNLLGRVFMGLNVDCPFRMIDALCAGQFAHAKVIVVDFHGEATSEKLAFARHLDNRPHDGRVVVVVGTHTHVQTADERILPHGTGFISDLGMCGSQAGVIGMRTDLAIIRLKDSMPASYQASEGELLVCGVLLEIDLENSKLRSIRWLQETPVAETAS